MRMREVYVVSSKVSRGKGNARCIVALLNRLNIGQGRRKVSKSGTAMQKLRMCSSYISACRKAWFRETLWMGAVLCAKYLLRKKTA